MHQHKWIPICKRKHVPSCYHLSYIDDGYRIHNQSFMKTGWSLLQFHNQTMNTWTHLLGACTMFYLFICDISPLYSVWNKSTTMNNIDFVFHFYSICATICFLGSSLFHWFQCVSEESHKQLLRIDLTGAGILVSANFIGVIYYGFYCEPFYFQLYIIQCIFTFIAGLIAPWTTGNIPYIDMKTGPFIFFLLVGAGSIPFIHWYTMSSEQIRINVFPGISCMVYSNIIGFFFFASKCPERIFPKSFIATQIIASHTIWHLFGLYAVYGMRYGMNEYRKILLENSYCSIEG